MALSLGRWSCSLGAGGAGCRASGGLSWCVPSLSPCILSAFPLCLPAIPAKYAFIWRFKGVFRGFYMFGVGLCCLGALRGLWGFCTRVQLGGFMTCGEFALLLFFFCSSFVLLCPAFMLFAFPLFVACSWLSFVVVVVSFSLSDLFDVLGKI